MNLYRRYFFSIISIVLLLLLGFLAPQFAEGQTDGYRKPKIYLFILDEGDACKPHGYERYDSDVPTYCNPNLDIDDVEQKKDICTAGGICATNETDLPITVRQFTIKLGALLEPVSAYCKKDPANIPPEKRKSMVIFFDWGTSQRAKITFNRIGDGEIPSMKWPGSLKNGTRWFNHQRLDAFDPDRSIKWALTVGKRQWEFSVEP
jgi:hypothetical protein